MRNFAKIAKEAHADAVIHRKPSKNVISVRNYHVLNACSSARFVSSKYAKAAMFHVDNAKSQSARNAAVSAPYAKNLSVLVVLKKLTSISAPSAERLSVSAALKISENAKAAANPPAKIAIRTAKNAETFSVIVVT